MEEKTAYKIDTKFNYEDGVLEINIPEIIAQLDEEDREALARLHTFESVMWEELKRAVRDDYATQTYYSTIHKLRIEMLSGDGADKILKKTVRGILIDLSRAEHYSKHNRDALWKLQQWCQDVMSFEERQRLKMPTVPQVPHSEHPPRVKDADVEKAIAEAKG